MTAGETWDSCLKEIEDLPAVKKYGEDVKVSMYMYDRPAWTGTVYETECFFPTWINKASAAHVQALVDAHHALFGDKRLGHSDAEPARDAMRLRQLEEENSRLRKMVAEQALDISILKDVLSKNF